MTSVRTSSRWVNKYGNVRTRLTVLDSTDPLRIRLRVLDSGGSTAYKRGRIITMDTASLCRYYALEGGTP